MKLLAIIQLTFRESLAKKTFMAFFGISSLAIILFLMAINLDIVNGADASMSVFGQDVDSMFNIEELVAIIQSGIAVTLFGLGVFLSLFATSSLVPRYLERGNIDLLISKPISRSQLLAGRFLGAVGIVAFNIYYLIIGTWIIISLKSGVWNWGYLLSGLMIIITFAILFALMTCMGVLIRSGPFSLMITYLVIFISPFLIARDQIYALLSSPVYGYLLDGLYHFLPKFSELGQITEALVRGISVDSWFPLWTSLGFGITMFAISTFIFSRKNF